MTEQLSTQTVLGIYQRSSVKKLELSGIPGGPVFRTGQRAQVCSLVGERRSACCLVGQKKKRNLGWIELFCQVKNLRKVSFCVCNSGFLYPCYPQTHGHSTTDITTAAPAILLEVTIQSVLSPGSVYDLLIFTETVHDSYLRPSLREARKLPLDETPNIQWS